ncbi:hypothetical protein BXZ70DRAFT_367394 [Cristinia sonorae]|uniref:Uncharacterized protein n=1 Tax=Cristinia sonorae TaxID=1940300 RepID=A0A8K0XN57_9AGAR|nr:hypothetical protein BXZ70DRAFT_367394 [Cristinia sonorae]
MFKKAVHTYLPSTVVLSPHREQRNNVAVSLVRAKPGSLFPGRRFLLPHFADHDHVGQFSVDAHRALHDCWRASGDDEGRTQDGAANPTSLVDEGIRSSRRLFLITLTGYRLANFFVIATIGTIKFALTVLGYSAALTDLEWMFGVIYALISYCVGMYKDVRPTVCSWLFHKDYTVHLILCISRFIRATCSIVVRFVLVPSLSLAMVFLPIRVMVRAAQSMRYGAIWWLPVTAWLSLYDRTTCRLWSRPRSLDDSRGTLYPGATRSLLRRLSTESGKVCDHTTSLAPLDVYPLLVIPLPRGVSLCSSGVRMFDVVDAFAGITVVTAAAVLRAVCGSHWGNSLKEVDNPAVLLALELARRLLRTTTDGKLSVGYAVVWMIVSVYWLLKQVSVQ